MERRTRKWTAAVHLQPTLPKSDSLLDAAEWRIPGSKMKMGQDHLVPLSTQTVEILRSVHPIRGHGRYVFPSVCEPASGR